MGLDHIPDNGESRKQDISMYASRSALLALPFVRDKHSHREEGRKEHQHSHIHLHQKNKSNDSIPSHGEDNKIVRKDHVSVKTNETRLLTTAAAAVGN